MKTEPRDFEVEILALDEIHELPGAWPAPALRALLDRLDVDEVGEDELLEMTVMALQDLEVDEASDLVLEIVFGGDMRPGVRQNLISDLVDERPWEEFTDLAMQPGIFDAVVLLQRAFPREFGKPDALAARVRIGAKNKTAIGWLDARPHPDAALLVRILAAGMDDHAVLRRLFEDALAADRFPEAPALLWRIEPHAVTTDAREFTLISSHQWFDALEDVEPFSARAWPDATDER